MKIKNLLTLLLCVSVGSTLYAQEAVSASGGNASGANGSASFTIGQVAYTVADDGFMQAAAGVQQGYFITDTTTIGVKETSLDLSLTAFPNPTTNRLLLQFDAAQFGKIPTGNISYELVDLQGKTVAQNGINAVSQSVDMSGLGASVYVLRVTQEGALIKTFKITKE